MTLGQIITQISKQSSVDTEGVRVPIPAFYLEEINQFQIALIAEVVAVTGNSIAACSVDVIFNYGLPSEQINSSVRLLNQQYKEILIPHLAPHFAIRIAPPSWIDSIDFKIYSVVGSGEQQTLLEQRISALESQIASINSWFQGNGEGLLPFSNPGNDPPVKWRRLTTLDLPIPAAKKGGLFKADFLGCRVALDETVGFNSISIPPDNKLQTCSLGNSDYGGGLQVSGASGVVCDRSSHPLPCLIFDGVDDGLSIPRYKAIKTIGIVLQPTAQPAAFCPVLGKSDGQGWHVGLNSWLSPEESASGFSGGQWWINGVETVDPSTAPIQLQPTAILIQLDSSTTINRIFCDRDAIGRFFPGKLWCVYLGNELLDPDYLNRFNQYLTEICQTLTQ